jgi:hypothetical protein
VSNIGATAFNAAYGAFVASRCQVRYDGRDVVSTALCTGLDEIKASTDQGQVEGYSGNLRLLTADEPRVLKAGEVIEIKRADDPDWIKMRVGIRHAGEGAVRYSIGAEFE